MSSRYTIVAFALVLAGGGHGASNDEQSEVEALRDALCACKDAACITRATQDRAALMMRLAQERGRDARPSEAVQASLDEMRKCVDAALGAKEGTEADLELDNLQGRLEHYFAAHHVFPAGVEGPTPSVACCAQPHTQCAATTDDWRLAQLGLPWGELGFQARHDKFFQYDYQGTASEVTVHATADWDCDPTNGLTTYTLHGRVAGGQPVFEIDQPKERK